MKNSSARLLLNEVILPLFSISRMSMDVGSSCLIPFHFIGFFCAFYYAKDETTAFNLEELVDHTSVIVVGESNEVNH